MKIQTVELGLVFTIDNHPETILFIKVERTMGAVSVFPGALESDARKTFHKFICYRG